MRVSRWRALVTLAVAAAAVTAAGPLAACASADHSQVAILQDDTRILADPAGTLLAARELGAGYVRLLVRWQHFAPDPDSIKAPGRFDAPSPASYPASNWAPYDAVLRDAAADGITVDFDVAGDAPLWATGPGKPPYTTRSPPHNWEPSAVRFGAFMRALGTRYSGSYDPLTRTLAPGNPNDLPGVGFWSIWNEPNYGPSLAPQALPGHEGVEDSPRMYRALLDAAWSALQATGHGSDTVLIGELAPRGSRSFGNFNGMLPLVFLRALYCLNSSYQPLRGAAATLRGCPATAAGSARFAAQNPGLFLASGFSDHPYMSSFPPDDEENSPPRAGFASLAGDYTSLALVGQLETALNRVLGAYGSRRILPIWDTEFGYMTSPPKRLTKLDRDTFPSPATAAYYDNWAEYMSWKDPRIMSFAQYLLSDPEPALQSNDFGGFASGLLNYGGIPKPGYDSWRMPIYLPRTAAARGQRLEVWGDVRPAHFTALDLPYTQQSVEILFAPAGSSDYTVLDSVAISNPEGYFDTSVSFPASGCVELRWIYPQDSLLPGTGGTVFSRKVQIEVG